MSGLDSLFGWHEGIHARGWELPVMESREEQGPVSRRSSRRTLAPAKPDCLLTIGSQRLPAVLADEGDANLHVLIQGSPLFWVEETGVLQIDEVEIAVRVSNIVRADTDEDDFSSSPPSFRIGLAREGHAPVKLVPRPVPISERKARSKLLSLRPLNRIRISPAGLIGFAMLATPLILVAAAWQHHARQSDSAAPQNAVVDTPNISNSPSSSPIIQPQPPQPVVPPIPDPTPEVLRLPGVEPFLKPEVARKLDVTPSQAGAFGRLNKTTQEALEDLEKYWESVGRLELAQRRSMLLEAARQEALQLLTAQQRRQWEAMTR
jgi:hypothetical protein